MEKFQQTIDNWEDPVSCAFVVLMAHGEEGLLKGEDGKMVKLDDLFEVLNNKNCRNLRAKPKVYIVQACRGGRDRPKSRVHGVFFLAYIIVQGGFTVIFPHMHMM
jgi:hypothetical protein